MMINRNMVFGLLIDGFGLKILNAEIFHPKISVEQFTEKRYIKLFKTNDIYEKIFYLGGEHSHQPSHPYQE